jgi:hypothetical protein
MVQQPKLNRTTEMLVSQSRPQQVPVEELLTAKGQQQRQRIEERNQRLDQQAKQLSQKSKVNYTSEKLMQERYILQGETVKDRLAKPIGKVKNKTLDQIEQHSFKPTINPTSLELLASSAGGVYYDQSPNGSGGGEWIDPHQQQLQHFNFLFEELNPQQPNPNEDEDGYDNAFSSPLAGRPSGRAITTSEPVLYEEIIRNRPGGGGGGGRSINISALGPPSAETAVFNKSQKWDEMRRRKLEKERQERLKKELNECSFTPKIKGYVFVCLFA